MENVLRFCCSTSQKAAEYVLKYVVDVVKIEAQKDLTHKDPNTDRVLKQICRLPFVLLFETESQFGVINNLHIILREIVMDLHMYIDKSYVDDSVFQSALQYFIDKFNTQTTWTECVLTANVYVNFEHGYDDVRDKRIELLSKMPQLKKIVIVYLKTNTKKNARRQLQFQVFQKLDQLERNDIKKL